MLTGKLSNQMLLMRWVCQQCVKLALFVRSTTKIILTFPSGISHILEHTTLCGSSKYPVRDPFFKMLNRSLSTFMNAMTGPDYTLYPFSTQNEKDFFNLMSVYLDAVFRPELKEQDFRQEGWRLERENVEDPASKFMIKGDTWKEMSN